MPQGSVLGPDYYSLSEYDLPVDEGENGAGIFADDNGIWVIADNCK